MIRHQTIRDHRRAVLLIILFHQPQEILIIGIVEENLSLSRAAVVDMIILPLRKSVTAIWHSYLLKTSRRIVWKNLVARTKPSGRSFINHLGRLHFYSPSR